MGVPGRSRRGIGCGILLDFEQYLCPARNSDSTRSASDAVDPGAVREIHLAATAPSSSKGQELLIDTHGTPVCDAVWNLYRAALRRFGDVPTLIEWDTDIPARGAGGRGREGRRPAGGSSCPRCVNCSRASWRPPRRRAGRCAAVDRGTGIAKIARCLRQQCPRHFIESLISSYRRTALGRRGIFSPVRARLHTRILPFRRLQSAVQGSQSPVGTPRRR